MAFQDTLYQRNKFELQCTLKIDLHIQVMMIWIVEKNKFIISCGHDDELLINLMKV